jgi:hypothetical protein
MIMSKIEKKLIEEQAKMMHLDQKCRSFSPFYQIKLKSVNMDGSIIED